MNTRQLVHDLVEGKTAYETRTVCSKADSFKAELREPTQQELADLDQQHFQASLKDVVPVMFRLVGVSMWFPQWSYLYIYKKTGNAGYYHTNESGIVNFTLKPAKPLKLMVPYILGCDL